MYSMKIAVQSVIQVSQVSIPSHYAFIHEHDGGSTSPLFFKDPRTHLTAERQSVTLVGRS